MKKEIRRTLWKLLGSPAKHPGLAQRVGREHATLIEKASRFVACEIVEGDYLEFGVYQGAAFTTSYHALKAAYRERIAQKAGEATPEQQRRRQKNWDDMRFFAFDSFEGLPVLKGSDTQTDDFKQGQYAATQDEFLKNITSKGVDAARVVPVKGWFSDTVNRQTFDEHELRKASVIWIDGDLYESARDVLKGIVPLLQDGTILIFDDWFAFKGNPNLGEQKAFHEWRSTVEGFTFNEYHKEGAWRNSFIACKKC